MVVRGRAQRDALAHHGKRDRAERLVGSRRVAKQVAQRHGTLAGVQPSRQRGASRGVRWTRQSIGTRDPHRSASRASRSADQDSPCAGMASMNRAASGPWSAQAPRAR